MAVEYFKDFDTDVVYACVGPMGVNALFRLRRSLTGKPEWEFLVPESPTWDSAHQRLYFDRRWVETVNPNELPEPIPPIPEIPRGPFPHPSEYFMPERHLDVSKYPYVKTFLRTRSDETVTVIVVLHEDLYETYLGDGEFHYFQDVFLTREDAQRATGLYPDKEERFHLRTMTIKLDSGALDFPDFRVELFDHYTVEQVLQRLEARLQAEPVVEGF
jgi:hypothetical protein